MSESETDNSIKPQLLACHALIIIFGLALFFFLLFSTSLFFFLLLWALGGPDYDDNLLGNPAISILLAGITMGIALKLGCLCRQKAGGKGSTTASTTLRNHDSNTQSFDMN